jgi:hypothetical protein
VDGYVFVCNESVPDERRARQILGAVDLALDRSGHRAVLFDTREMPAPSDEVNTILRSWVDACRYHDKVALLVKSDLKLIASNMRAIAAKVKLRSSTISPRPRRGCVLRSPRWPVRGRAQIPNRWPNLCPSLRPPSRSRKSPSPSGRGTRGSSRGRTPSSPSPRAKNNLGSSGARRCCASTWGISDLVLASRSS